MAKKLVTKIVVSYTIDGEPGEFTLTNEEGGQEVDGVIWSKELVDKLYYAESGNAGNPGNADNAGNAGNAAKCRPVGKRKGGGGWKVKKSGGGSGSLSSGANTLSSPVDCTWLHEESCFWVEYC